MGVTHRAGGLAVNTASVDLIMNDDDFASADAGTEGTRPAPNVLLPIFQRTHSIRRHMANCQDTHRLEGLPESAATVDLAMNDDDFASADAGIEGTRPAPNALVPRPAPNALLPIFQGTQSIVAQGSASSALPTPSPDDSLTDLPTPRF